MPNRLSELNAAIEQLKTTLLRRQKPDGAWYYCFDNGIATDTSVIILLRSLEIHNETLIRQLHDRILAAQLPDGGWRLYADEEEGNLSASVEAYYALLYSGYSQRTDEPIQRARSFIQSKGGLGQVTSHLTRVILAATGQSAWPAALSMIPLEIILFPASSPINVFDFSGYGRVHLVPMLIAAHRQFSISTERTPDLNELLETREGTWSVNRNDPEELLSGEYQAMLGRIRSGRSRLIGSAEGIHEAATKKAEQFMLERIESDGTLYSYASSTIMMIFALLALGYERQHSLIAHAVEGLTKMACTTGRHTTIQNSPSTIWDTALLAYALQEAGVREDHEPLRRAEAYLLAKQQHKPGDWTIHNPGIPPGGWGFSPSNTINPDVDDTTAALRAVKRSAQTDAKVQEAWNRGLQWVISMQNDDGGWPAFEKNVDNQMLAWLTMDGASAAIDPSSADLTGRALEYLGNFEGLTTRHAFIERGARWLMDHQEANGSWYGRWGICYIYGTWAALTGLMAVGVSSDHETVRKGTEWLLRIQNPDGGWGESCRSDRLRRYVALRGSTPSQTAWALDALIAVHPEPTAAMRRGIHRLIASLHEENWLTDYPTGAGLPGNFYIRYHSYRYIWPLLALSHYKKKFGDV